MVSGASVPVCQRNVEPEGRCAVFGQWIYLIYLKKKKNIILNFLFILRQTKGVFIGCSEVIYLNCNRVVAEA